MSLTGSEGVDYSFGRPGGAALAAAGKRFAVRYVPYPGDGGKGLTRAEMADLHDHGIAIALVFESTAGRARGGYNAGATDAQTSLEAIAALGFPAATPIYFAVDFDAEVDHYDVIQHYLDGAASVIGRARVGLYGGIRVVNEMRRRRAATWFWQTYAWSAGDIAGGLHLYQYRNGQRINGAAVDYVRAYASDFGQFMEEAMPAFPFRVPGGARAGTVTIPAGIDLFRVKDGARSAAKAATTSGTSAIHDVPDGSPGFLVTTVDGTFWVRSADVQFAPTVVVDCDDVVAVELDKAAGRAAEAVRSR